MTKMPPFFDEASFNAELAEIGYRRRKRYVYKAEWGGELEHYLYVDLAGSPRQFMQVEFGVRSPEAQAFAIQCLDTYGAEIYRLTRHKRYPLNCYMRFSLGRAAGWGLLSSLDLYEMAGKDVAAKVRRDLEQKAFPAVRNVTTPDRLLDLLVTDRDPCPWFSTNAALRAAMIAYLARGLGVPPRAIRVLLDPHRKEIAQSLGEPPDPTEYIERIIKDASSAATTA